MSADRAFEAPDLIEVMDEAVLYNRFLIDELHAWSTGLAEGPVLDFGAGNGRFAGALHDLAVPVEVVEPDPTLRARISARGVRAWESLDALAERGHASLAGLYSINVLEHLEDDRGFLEHFARVLQPGGGLFLYVPAFPILFSANDVRVGHLRRYRLRPLARLLAETGFSLNGIRYVDSLGWLAGLAYRFFGNADGDLSVGAVKLYDRAVFPLSRLLDRAVGGFVGKNLLVHAIRSQ